MRISAPKAYSEARLRPGCRLQILQRKLIWLDRKPEQLVASVLAQGLLDKQIASDIRDR
jgi:hypothetical protein